METNLPMLPSAQEWEQMKDMAVVGVKSGLLPSSIRTPEAALIIMLKGRELGIKPLVAFSNIHVINGRPGCSAELMLASIRQTYPKTSIQYVQSTDKICHIRVKRENDSEPNEFKFTIEEAQKAGLTSKDVWRNYATDMLRARAISRMKRAMFPEVLMGLSHTPEELEDTQPKIVSDFKPEEMPNVVTQAAQKIVSINDISEAKPEEKKPEAQQPDEQEQRKMLVAKIVQFQKLNCYTNDQMTQKVQTNFGKPTLQLSITELQNLLELLIMEAESKEAKNG